MPYATADDIVTLYGQNALVVADHDRDGIPDETAIARALEMASGEMDTYLGRRYRLPLTATPSHLVQINVDIALYRLALSADVASEEHRRRYDDALKALTLIADGRTQLNLPPPDPDPNAEPGAVQITGPQPIVTGGPARIFSRDQMREL